MKKIQGMLFIICGIIVLTYFFIDTVKADCMYSENEYEYLKEQSIIEFAYSDISNIIFSEPVVVEKINKTYACLEDKRINIYEYPNDNSVKIGLILKDCNVFINGLTDNNWYQIKLSNGNLGYISNLDFLSEYEGVIIHEEDVKSTSLYYMQDLMEEIPESIKNEFFLDNWRIQLDDRQQQSDEDGFVTAGEIFYQEKLIRINAPNGDKRYIKKAVIHEFGHYIDYCAGRPSDYEEFLKIYYIEKDTIVFHDCYRNYIISNPHEYFAESYNEYICHENEFKSSAPMTYQFLKNVLKENGYM